MRLCFLTVAQVAQVAQSVLFKWASQQAIWAPIKKCNLHFHKSLLPQVTMSFSLASIAFISDLCLRPVQSKRAEAAQA